MTAPARTVFAFGVYLVSVGLVLLLVPNVLLGVLGLPATDEPWLRLVGVIVLVLGGYYVVCARAEATVFVRATVAGRTIAAGGLVMLALMWGYWALLLFATFDVACAAWTRSALRRADASAGAPVPAA